MNDDIPAALWAVWERVRDLTASDPELRDRVHSFAELLLKLTKPAQTTETSAQPRGADTTPLAVPPREPLPPITFHLPRPVPPPAPFIPAGPIQPQVSDADLAIIEM